MKRQPNRKAILSVFIVLFCSALLFLLNTHTERTKPNKSLTFERAEVLEVMGENLQEDEIQSGVYRGSQDVRLKILTGALKSEEYVVKNHVSALYSVICRPGGKVIVTVDTNPNATYAVSVYSYDRSVFLYIMIALFFACMGIIGGKKGIWAMIGLTGTFVCIVFLFVPMIYRGYSPILSAIFLSVLTTVLSFLLLTGYSLKTLCAVLGTVSGVTIAGFVSSVAGNIAHLSGFHTQEAETLMLIARDHSMQVKGVLFAGILIASLGAVMDTAMSITAALYEMKEQNTGMTQKKLFSSGIHIGQDMIGTMANTLILAFTGSSLGLIITIYSYGIPYYQLINSDMVGIEIMQSMTGSIAIILTVPITSLITSFVLNARHNPIQTHAPQKIKGLKA